MQDQTNSKSYTFCGHFTLLLTSKKFIHSFVLWFQPDLATLCLFQSTVVFTKTVLNLIGVPCVCDVASALIQCWLLTEHCMKLKCMIREVFTR